MTFLKNTLNYTVFMTGLLNFVFLAVGSLFVCWYYVRIFVMLRQGTVAQARQGNP